MEQIHQDSSNVHKAEAIGRFETPGTQVDNEAGHWEVIKQTQSLDNATSVEFLAPAGPSYTDLSNSYIRSGLEWGRQ